MSAAQYELIQEGDFAAVKKKIQEMAADGWRVHTFQAVQINRAFQAWAPEPSYVVLMSRSEGT